MAGFLKWVNALMAVFNAAKNNPELWQAIQDVIDLFDNTPDGALAQTSQDLHDRLQKAVDDAPEAKAALRDYSTNNPDGTQAFGIGEVGALLAILKQLYDFWKARKK